MTVHKYIRYSPYTPKLMDPQSCNTAIENKIHTQGMEWDTRFIKLQQQRVKKRRDHIEPQLAYTRLASS